LPLTQLGPVQTGLGSQNGFHGNILLPSV
jgi:hypothetical protein